MALAGGPALLVNRAQDPRLTALLRSNSVRIGHVPVTAINSLVSAQPRPRSAQVGACRDVGADAQRTRGTCVWHGT